MTKVAVSKKELLSFLKLVAVKGEIENKEALLSISKDGIDVRVISADRSLAISGSLNAEFEDIGDVGIDNIQQFIKIVEAMGNDFNISFSSNKVTVQTAKSKLTNVLRSAEYIVNKLETDKFKSVKDKTTNGISFVLPNEVLKDIVSKFKLIDSKELQFIGKDNELKVKSKNTDDETEFETIYDIALNGTFSIKLNAFIIDLFDSISTDVAVGLAKENPNVIHICAKNDSYSFDYLIALLVQEESEEPKKKKK